MTKQEYVTTFYINGARVDVGIDDYGQCYFIEFEKDGEKQEIGLGTYNTEYVEAGFYYLDPVYKHLHHRVYTDELTESESELYEAYNRLIRGIYEDMIHD